MAITININGLSLCHEDSGGFVTSTVPDVCLTPSGPVPVPYTISSFSKDLVKGTATVFADGGNSIAHKPSEFSCCFGDEPGVSGGVASGVFGDKSTWITFSPDVFIEKEPACRLTDKMFMNKTNTVSTSLVQKKVKGTKIAILCEIFCEVREKGRKAKANGAKRFNYSNEAKKLAEGKYKKRLMKAMGDFKAEKTVVGLVKKGALGNTKRKVMSQSALKKRLTKELREKLAKKVAVKVGKKAFLKLIPVVNVVSTVYDVVDTAIMIKDISSQVDKILKNYDAFRIRPDMAEIGPNGEIKRIYDYKFDYPSGGADSMPESQRKLYKAKTGKNPKVIDNALCKCK